MKKKYIAIFVVIIVLVAFCAVGAGLASAAEKPTAVNTYEEMLSKTTSSYTDADLAESSAAYLLNADFDVTGDNFYQSFYDYLAAPVRLYYADVSIDTDTWYKCDAPEINVKFAGAFKDLPVYEIAAEDFNRIKDGENDYSQYSFKNALGRVDVLFYFEENEKNFDKETYVAFERGDDTVDYFYVDGNLYFGVDYAAYKVLDYSMEAKKAEVE